MVILYNSIVQRKVYEKVYKNVLKCYNTIYKKLKGGLSVVEKTLVLIKPDGVRKNLIGRVINTYEEAGLKVEKLKLEQVGKEFAAKHYNKLKDKPFYEDLVMFISGGPICAMVLSGENAINKVRQINGNTDPKLADKGTIRALYGTDKTHNCVHASDTIENAEEEIEYWFK